MFVRGIENMMMLMAMRSLSFFLPCNDILAVRSGEENLEKIKALAEVLKSDKVKAYIEKTYEGEIRYID